MIAKKSLKLNLIEGEKHVRDQNIRRILSQNYVLEKKISRKKAINYELRREVKTILTIITRPRRPRSEFNDSDENLI